jgi:hypothetical protein
MVRFSSMKANRDADFVPARDDWGPRRHFAMISSTAPVDIYGSLVKTG